MYRELPTEFARCGSELLYHVGKPGDASIMRNIQQITPRVSHTKAAWNEDLREIPGYLRDEDLAYDSTYACFHFTPPAGYEDVIELVKAEQSEFDPSKAFAQVLDDLKSGTKTPETERALKLGEDIAQQIREGLGGGSRIIEV